ncbi:MAG: DUF2586 family protein [Bacteroidales bacterium]|jgi:hypothetical protein|nr:DUF2586 family protein [Bacteroidales bacterium]
MLPRVKIYFENGALGSVIPSPDGVVGLVCTGATVDAEGGLSLAIPYVLRKLDDLVALGVTSDAADANAFLYKQVSEFYAEAGEGAELWLMCFPNTVTQSALVNQTQAYAKSLIQAAQGRIRALAVAFNPASGYTPTITNGVDADLFGALTHAQALAEWATNTLFAPLFILLEAKYFSGTVSALQDLATNTYNRVGVMLGDTAEDSDGAAVGLLLGRIARIPVQRHIGRVRDNAVNTVQAFIGATAVEQADQESINDKGYITFRTFVGRAGYFFADDSLATKVADDYRSIARRRTIDKAYRVAYAALLDYLNDEIPITDSGELVPAMAKSWEMEVIQAIVNQMTAEGNLGVDTTDPKDNGVKCFIDYAQKVVSTNKVEVVVQVKPYGYAKYIDVKLGFITVNN